MPFNIFLIQSAARSTLEVLQTGTLRALPPSKTPRPYILLHWEQQQQKLKAAGGHNYQNDSGWFLDTHNPSPGRDSSFLHIWADNYSSQDTSNLLRMQKHTWRLLKTASRTMLLPASFGAWHLQKTASCTACRQNRVWSRWQGKQHPKAPLNYSS